MRSHNNDTNMGDMEDMNATPLGKLPMPAVQSKGDGPRVDMSAASYSDILKEMNNNVPAAVGPPQQPQFQQFQQQGPPPQQMMMAPPQQQQQMMQHMMMAAPASRSRRGGRAPAAAHKRGDGGGGGWMARAREYKTSLLVAVVVFLVLSYAAPKLAQLAPQLLTPMGKFNTMGLLLIGASCGGIHRVMDHYIK